MIADDFAFSNVNAIYNHSLLYNLILYYYSSAFAGGSRVFTMLLDLVLFGKSYLYYTLPILNIVSGIMLVVWLNLVYVLVWGRDNFKLKKFVILITIYLFYEILVVHDFAETFMWKTITIQSWGAVILLFTLVNFYYDLFKPAKFYQIILYCLLGLLLPFWHEVYIAFTLAVAISSIVIVLLFKPLPLKALFKYTHLAFLFGMSLSSYFVLTAPGNFIRTHTILSSLPATVQHTPFITKLLMTYEKLFVKNRYILLVSLIVLALIWLYRNRLNISNSLIAYFVFLILLLNLDILSFFQVTYFYPISGRMRLFIDLISFVLLFKAMVSLWQIKGYTYRPNWLSTWLVFIILLSYLSISYNIIYRLGYDRDHLIRQLKANGETNLIIPQWCVNGLLKLPIYFDDIVYPNETYYSLVNMSIANYYNVKSITPKECIKVTAY